ncbi:unnamed protein product [Heterosigma akashiwo]
MGQVREWPDALLEDGPKYGYYPEPRKSIAIVKDWRQLERAKQEFQGLGLEFVEASRFLGGFLGKEEVVRQLLEEKVTKWVEAVEDLSEAAVVYPQDAYVCFLKSLQCEWGYVQRVVEGAAAKLEPLDRVIQDKFLPAVFGRELQGWEKELVKVAPKKGGLGVRSPTETAEDVFQLSVVGSAVLVAAMKEGTMVAEEDHDDQLRRVRREMKDRWGREEDESTERLVAGLPKRARRALERVLRKENVSGWLTVGPSREMGFDLPAQMFRDRLNMRHGQGLQGLPAVCDGCGEPFSLEHALCCKKGGLVKKGHDHLVDESCHLASLAYGAGVKKEPFLRDASGKVLDKDLRADFMALSVWERQRVAIFDNRILDADAPSRFNRNMSYVTAMRTAVQEKKKKYQERCEDLAGSFTPLVCTVDGVFHREFVAFMKRVAAVLAEKWHKPYGVVMCWVRVRLQFALIRAVDLRLRGSRKAFHGFGMMDGAGMGLVY